MISTLSLIITASIKEKQHPIISICLYNWCKCLTTYIGDLYLNENGFFRNMCFSPMTHVQLKHTNAPASLFFISNRFDSNDKTQFDFLIFFRAETEQVSNMHLVKGTCISHVSKILVQISRDGRNHLMRKKAKIKAVAVSAGT